jgi:hypothetical protein
MAASQQQGRLQQQQQRQQQQPLEVPLSLGAAAGQQSAGTVHPAARNAAAAAGASRTRLDVLSVAAETVEESQQEDLLAGLDLGAAQL